MDFLWDKSLTLEERFRELSDKKRVKAEAFYKITKEIGELEDKPFFWAFFFPIGILEIIIPNSDRISENPAICIAIVSTIIISAFALSRIIILKLFYESKIEEKREKLRSMISQDNDFAHIADIVRTSSSELSEIVTKLYP